MRRLMLLTAALLSFPLLAGSAVGNSNGLTGVCHFLEHRVDQCESGTRLRPKTRASRDRFEQGARALCGALEPISASAAAESAALDLLREDYAVVPIENAIGSVFPNHVVIGPADLDNPDVIAALREAYQVGKTVAIADATADAVRRFHRLLRAGQEPNCTPLEGSSAVELYGLQRSVTRTPPEASSYCLLSLDGRDPAADRRWLRERFTEAPPQPQQGQGGPADEPTEFLTSLASATHCDFKYSPPGLGSVEVDLNTWAMRNFTDTGCGSCTDPGADYYLVEDSVTFTPIVSGASFVVDIRKPIEATTSEPLGDVVGLEFSDPATDTGFVKSYTNSSTTTVNASVGLSKSGPNVTAGETVTTNQSQTVNVPATTIDNNSFTPTAEPSWLFKPQSLSANTDFEPTTTWVWFVPQDAYPNGGTSGQIAFSSGANIFTSSTNSDVYQTCNVPYPFSAWTVSQPQLSSVECPSGAPPSSCDSTTDPISVSSAGGQFTITGQYLYPGSVTAVLIGGTPVPLATNVDLRDDTTIGVTVGGANFSKGNIHVQVNTQFNGETRFSNTLSINLTD